jgi:hypothetical protein
VTPKDWSRTCEGRCYALPQSPHTRATAGPDGAPAHLHSPTTRPIKQTELFPGILDCSETWRNGAAVLQRKGPTAEADEPCEKPSARGELHARQSKRTAVEGLLSSRPT